MPLVRAAGLATLLLALGACQLRVELDITVESDGSGTVTLSVGATEADVTTADLEQLERAVAANRLAAAGWDIRGPSTEPASTGEEPMVWIRATRSFVDEIDFAEAVSEIGGPFRDFSLAASSGFTEKVVFSGTVDFTVPDSFAAASEDREIAGELDAIGAAVDDLVTVRVAVRLPGDVSANAPTVVDNGAVWHLSVSEPEPVVLLATGERWTLSPALGPALAALSSAFVLVTVVVFRRRRRASTSRRLDGHS